ncbi:MAG: hypothetical protein ACJ788_01125 [Ktedonobacteraceae bacterium]
MSRSASEPWRPLTEYERLKSAILSEVTALETYIPRRARPRWGEPRSSPFVHRVLRLRGRRHQLDKQTVVQWSRLPPDACDLAREAGRAVAHGFFAPPSLAPFPTSPVYMDEMLAPREQP